MRDVERGAFNFGTKAETLERLSSKLTIGHIFPLVRFSKNLWEKSQPQCFDKISQIVGDEFLIVRSSAEEEDNETDSQAGQYLSVLNVPGKDKKKLADAIDQVFCSYSGSNKESHIFIQPMVQDVSMVGVVLTHEIDTGAPYYVINYDDESGRTDTVTGGTGVNKTVMVWHGADHSLIESERIRKVLQAVIEVEQACGGVPLDIEFATDSQNKVYILQARRISVQNNWPEDVSKNVQSGLLQIKDFIVKRLPERLGVYGRRGIYGEMSDWNPAEMIGSRPRPLAFSLYRELITERIWRESRALMGYHHPIGEELMMMLGNQPFIDIRNSFNSLLPEQISRTTAETLVSAWLERLAAHPELHDKVEFDVTINCMNFSHNETLNKRYPGLLTNDQSIEFSSALKSITERAITGEGSGSLQKACKKIQTLKQVQRQRSLSFLTIEVQNCNPTLIMTLLDQCRELGTCPFSIIARHAFIAESLLRSIGERGVLDESDITMFKASIKTVAGNLVSDMKARKNHLLSDEEFLSRYGHLRPSTYDITSSRYDQMEGFLTTPVLPPDQVISNTSFELNAVQRQGIETLIKETGFLFSPDQLINYIRRAIKERELAKSIFSRHLSDILELIATWCGTLGISREEASYLTIEDIRNVSIFSITAGYDIQARLRQTIEEKKLTMAQTEGIRLSYLVRDEGDIFVVPLHRSAPNFITNKVVHGKVVRITGREKFNIDLEGKIIFIENADPGFDWLFSKNIKGLVTKYGGANSHMAIRCSEFSIPAAIGCGEQTFDRLVVMDSIELDGGSRKLGNFHD
jgi:glutamine kinase